MDVREGTMRTKDGLQLPLEATDVAVEVAGPLAEVAVTQTFHNPLDRSIEATYLFPLPHGAAVHRMCFEVAGRVVECRVKEKEEARREFIAARHDGQRATLLEQSRPDLFTLAVTHIQPGERVKVAIAYHETLQYQDGEYRFHFPLVAADRPAGPEPCPDAEELRVRRLKAAERPPNVSLCVRLADREARPHSPTHDVEVSAGLVTLAPGDRLPNRDFVLTWATERTQVFLHRQAGLPGTFLANLLPPGLEREAPFYDLLILFDRSCSLQGQSTEQARRAVDHVLSVLRPRDGFQIVAFHHLCTPLVADGGFVFPSARNLTQARGFVRDLAPSGGTDLEQALRQVAAHPARPGRPRQILLITDANCFLPNQTDLPPVHVLGLGAAVNRSLLEGLARRTGGSWEALTPFEEPTAALERLGRRLRMAGPVLTNVQLDWQGGAVSDVYPAVLPALHAGQPLAVVGRFEGRGPSRLVVTGLLPDGSPWRGEQDVELPERSSEAPGLERVWARRRIDARANSREEVIALALRYSLVTPFTSFVGVDQESLLGEPEQVTVAVPELAGSAGAHREARTLLDMSATDFGPLRARDSSESIRCEKLPAARAGLFGRSKPRLAGGAPPRAAIMKEEHSTKPLFGRRVPAEAPLVLRSCRIPTPEGAGGAGPPRWSPPASAELPPLEDYYPPDELTWAEGKLDGALDLVFLVDETGSMGPYIMTVQQNILRILETISSLKLCRRLQVGLVRYRDHPPQDTSYVTRVHALTENFDHVRKAVCEMEANGGGDAPEAVTDGLHDLLNLNWRQGSVRTVVWIGDAPPHGVCPSRDGFPQGCPCGRHWQVQAEACREMGIVIHAVGAGHLGVEGTEEVFRTVAATTRGHFVSLDRAPLLIPLITGVAAQDLDRQRVEGRVAELLAEHRVALSRLGHPDDRCEFLLAHLRRREVRARVLGADFGLRWADLTADDVRWALASRSALPL